MNRRGFLAALAAAFVAPDPEKLLWVPGRKLISIPRPRGNRLLTNAEYLAHLHEIWERAWKEAAYEHSRRVVSHMRSGVR